MKSFAERPAWNRLLLICAVFCLFEGFLFSRAALSIGVPVFFAAALLYANPKAIVARFFSTPYWWLVSLLFWMPLVSGIWSTNLNDWFNTVSAKIVIAGITLLFIKPLFSRQHMIGLSLAFIVLVTTGTIWSVLQYVHQPEQINESYKVAKVLLTPAGADYIRFSLGVCMAFLLGIHLLFENEIANRFISISLAILLVWLVIYLHILSSKTGVLGVYIIMLIYAVALAVRTKNRWIGWLALTFLLIIPVVAYFMIPTFHWRVHYVWWDFYQYSSGNFMQGLADGNRVLSLKAALSIFSTHPMMGVGFGDLFDATRQWYLIHAPWMRPEDVIYPTNEILLYAAGAGVLAGVLVLTVMVYPFFIRMKRLSFYAFHALWIFAFLTDISMEVQCGIFLYAFFYGWMYWLAEK